MADHAPSAKTIKSKMCAQEVIQIEEVVPVRTYIKTINVNVNNLLTKNNEVKHKIIAENRASTRIHI